MDIKARFCAKCGKKTSKLIDGFCADCYFEGQGISIPRRASINVCRICGAIRWKGMWIKTDLPPEYYITHNLISKTKIPKEAELDELKILQLGKKGQVQVTIKILDKKFTQVHPVELHIKETKCLDCAQRLAEHHKAIIQIRTELRPQEFVNKVIKFAEKYRSNIIKAESQKRGVDLYFVSKEAARHLASELRKQFHMKIKESYEQYGWDKSKDRPKYRTIILLKKFA